jgi:anti-sigma regulatory factor (Ser/Thr protein kinase)
MSLRVEHGIATEEFRHDALFYAGDSEFVELCSRFVEDGLQAGEPVLVAVIPKKIDMLRDALGDAAGQVLFVDMARIGRNPSRIIPVWHDFITDRPDLAQRVRGIGEPIWAGRTGDEIVEAQRHESLINLAFQDAPGWILCPYDTRSLPDDVLTEAYRSHPYVAVGSSRQASNDYLGLQEIGTPFQHPLPAPQGPVEAMAITPGCLAEARQFVSARASSRGLDNERIEDLRLTVSELVANTLAHGGGQGTIRIWAECDDVVMEVLDEGSIDQPLIGRKAPAPAQEGGRGMWMVNQLCDLVQVRTHPGGSVIRVRMDRR